MKVIKIFIILIVVLCTSINANTQSKKNISITGKVVHKRNNKPLEFVTVIVAKKSNNTPIDGITTSQDGTFQLKTNNADFYVQFSSIGFKTKRIYNSSGNNHLIDLQTITLEEDALALDEVIVQGEKSTTEFKLDKRIFNVGQDLSSTGASALEVLNNVPSVTVNIEGQVSLRGSSGVQMLINGKPSVLASEGGNTLGTITANMIKKIEIITNPSAKYSAEGTSGIINIVLKKNEKKGLNGSITLNTGFPNNHSLGLSLNQRTEKFNLFSQLGVGYRTFLSESKTVGKDFKDNTEVNSNGESDKNEEFYNAILGADYMINKYNTLTLSGRFSYEKETENSNDTFQHLTNNSLNNSWSRSEKAKATNPKYEYELQYRKQFKNNKEHTLLASATGNFFGKDKNSDFKNNTITGVGNNTLQKTHTNFKEIKYNYKLDYNNPFTDVFTLETGAQYQINDVSNDYKVSNYKNSNWVVDNNLTNVFNYNQKVLGAYSILSYQGEHWGLKTGLRMENTHLNTKLKNTNEKNKKNYTDWFPSIHTSYKISRGFSLQAGYSRRIFRPRLWDLNPFFNIRNNYNIFTGNPNLKPEYSDSYELSSIHQINNISFNFSLYYRYTTDVMENAVSFENNVSIRKPHNIGTNVATGFEANGKYNAAKWLSFNGDFNFNYYNRKGNFENQSFDFTSSKWHTRLTTKLKLPAKFDIEISGRYRSKSKSFQQSYVANWSSNLGLRKKILKGRGIINFSVRDLFSSRKREATSSQTDYYTFNTHQRGRYIILGFSFGFGKGEAMEFSGAKRF